MNKENRMKTKPDIINRFSGKSLYIALAAGLFIITLALFTYPFSVEAMGRFGFRESPDQIVEHLTDSLGLTKEQVEAIRPIITDRALKMKEIREKSGIDKQAARTEIQKLWQDTETKLNAILTDEQIKKHEQLRQENRGRFYKHKCRGDRMGKGFHRTPENVITFLKDRLDLTDQQAAAIEPVIKESIEKKHEVFDNYGDNRQEIRQAMRDKLQGIDEETQKQLSSILTDAQMQDLRTLREERRARMEK
jgi:predicted DNA-binding protein YlxM (UPF0122 family)